jgi:putative aldouronate transport system permease protein
VQGDVRPQVVPQSRIALDVFPGHPVFLSVQLSSHAGGLYRLYQVQLQQGHLRKSLHRWKNFAFLFSSGQLSLLLRNTVLYNLAFILIGNFLQ